MMWDGFGRSVNTYFVWLAEQVGQDKVVEMAQRLGITFRADSDAAFAKNNAANWGSFTLGVAATTPLDLANAYATVAAEGTYCTPVPVVSVTAADGTKVPVGQPSCKRVLDADVARAATDAARCPVGQQSAFGQCNGGTATGVNDILDGRPVAGKTGSSEQNSTETFVGFTPQVAVAGIAANPDDPADSVGSAVQTQGDRRGRPGHRHRREGSAGEDVRRTEPRAGRRRAPPGGAPRGPGTPAGAHHRGPPLSPPTLAGPPRLTVSAVSAAGAVAGEGGREAAADDSGPVGVAAQHRRGGLAGLLDGEVRRQHQLRRVDQGVDHHRSVGGERPVPDVAHLIR